MKKLLFILAFAFIGHQAFSQMYIVTIASSSIGGCQASGPYTEHTLTTVDPLGIETHKCIYAYIDKGGLISLNQELNNIIGQGYKLIEVNNGQTNQNGTINSNTLNLGTTFFLAIP